MEKNEEGMIRLEIPAKTYVKYYMKKKGYPLRQPCKGKGECAECLIRVVEGKLVPSLNDILRLDEKTLGRGWRLGCKAVTDTPITIEFSASEVKSRNDSVFAKLLHRK